MRNKIEQGRDSGVGEVFAVLNWGIRKASLSRWPLNKDLKEVCEPCGYMGGGHCRQREWLCKGPEAETCFACCKNSKGASVAGVE